MPKTLFSPSVTTFLLLLLKLLKVVTNAKRTKNMNFQEQINEIKTKIFKVEQKPKETENPDTFHDIVKPNSKDLYHLFFYLQDRYKFFHVDCDHISKSFAPHSKVTDFLSFCEAHDQGLIKVNHLEFLSWGDWLELKNVA